MQDQYFVPCVALMALFAIDCAAADDNPSASGSNGSGERSTSAASGGSSGDPTVRKPGAVSVVGQELLAPDGGLHGWRHGRWSRGARQGASSVSGDASSGSATSGATSGGSVGGDASSGSATSGATSGGSVGGGGSSGSTSGGSVGAGGSSGSSSSGGASSGASGAGTPSATPPQGWLFTKGNAIYVSDGGSVGTQWVGRGVNMDDIFLCGYDNSLQMSSPGGILSDIASGLIQNWKPTFIRMSLSMDSYGTAVTWAGNAVQYSTPMTNVINAIGANPAVYVLVTLRSDPSMIGEDTSDGDAEATGLPSDSTTTPDATKYPTGTDATYVALVDAFANSRFVLFGLTNEPGGDKLSNATIGAAMNHAVGTIRAEEDRLGVPHHLVSVQGNGWSSDLSFYVANPSPITYDNVIYELHYYPGGASETPNNYQYSSTLPMIVGEYGDFTSSVTQSSFYADMESKGIPNLAWDFEPYSDCSPDLLNVTTNTTLTASSWGSTVQSYLLAH